MRVKIIFRLGYNEGNDFWYFKPENNKTIYEVEEYDEEQYLALNPPDPAHRYFIRVLSKVFSIRSSVRIFAG